MNEDDFDEAEFLKRLDAIMRSWTESPIHNYQSESNEEIAARETKELMARLMLPKKDTK